MASVRAWSLVCRAFVLIVVPTIGVADEGMTFNKDELLRKGYSLDRETMRAILKEGKTSVPFCLGFIAEQNYSDLTPDVKAYRARLNLEDYVDSCNWCSATECLFQIDKDMSREEVKSSVEVIRQELFQKGWKSEPFESYEALLAAERWKGVDIKDDLLRLASGHTVRFNIRSLIGRLFDLYGAQLTEVDIRPILDAWAGDTKISRYVRRKAEAVGIALPPEVVQGQGGDQSKETAPPTPLDGSVLIPSRSLTDMDEGYHGVFEDIGFERDPGRKCWRRNLPTLRLDSDRGHMHVGYHCGLHNPRRRTVSSLPSPTRAIVLESLDLGSLDIGNLTGLEHCTGLTTLSLDDNPSIANPIPGTHYLIVAWYYYL